INNGHKIGPNHREHGRITGTLRIRGTGRVKETRDLPVGIVPKSLKLITPWKMD
ncbi:hypothetical protein ACJMK2_008935, partial [Sinanodonta woodiana]